MNDAYHAGQSSSGLPSSASYAACALSATRSSVRRRSSIIVVSFGRSWLERSPWLIAPGGRRAGAERLDAELAADEAEGAAGAGSLELVHVHLAVAHIRKMPNVLSGTGAFDAAEIPSASTRRVSRGSMMPSSHNRAVE